MTALQLVREQIRPGSAADIPGAPPPAGDHISLLSGHIAVELLALLRILRRLCPEALPLLLCEGRHLGIVDTQHIIRLLHVGQLILQTVKPGLARVSRFGQKERRQHPLSLLHEFRRVKGRARNRQRVSDDIGSAVRKLRIIYVLFVGDILLRRDGCHLPALRIEVHTAHHPVVICLQILLVHYVQQLQDLPATLVVILLQEGIALYLPRAG